MEENNTQVIEKLSKVQQRLKVTKDHYNSFGAFNYRSLEDILEALKPLLADVGATLLLSDKPISIGTTRYIEVTAVFICPEGSLSVTACARETEEKKKMDASQLTGCASSYARKYALGGLFLLDDNKDADTEAYSKNNAAKESTKYYYDLAKIDDANREKAKFYAREQRCTNTCATLYTSLVPLKPLENAEVSEKEFYEREAHYAERG